MLRGSICLWGQAFYTQSCEGSLLNFGFAYNSESISVPAKLEMEISYRFIRNPAKRLYRISILRITSRASPSPRGLKWKNFTELYAILRRSSTESHFCVQLQEHLCPRKTGNGNILQIYTQSCEEALQNLTFAYNFRGISVPARLEMEISYRFIRNPTKKLYRISLLRTTSRASLSPQDWKWKYLTDLYAILRRSSTESHFCV